MGKLTSTLIGQLAKTRKVYFIPCFIYQRTAPSSLQHEDIMNEIETFYGLVENTLDALRIFQMCRDGRLNRVRRRLHERERRLIRSGSVFVFDEEESGIRRWTDGRLWSPSRILGNFLIYRELEKKSTSKVQGGAGKRDRDLQASTSAISAVPKILPKGATESLDMLWGIPKGNNTSDWMSNEQLTAQSINPQELQSNSLLPRKRTQSDISPLSSSISSSINLLSSDPTSGESLRALKSKKLSNNHKGRYIFKSDGGLIKKTISIQLEGHTHQLVAYYSLEDFCRGHLQLKDLQDNENENLEHAEHAENENDIVISEQQNRSQLPFDPQLMEILRQVPIPVDLMLQQNFRKPAALLASATTTAQNLIANDPEKGEKLITALEYGAINPSDLQSPTSDSNSAGKKNSTSFVPGGGIIFSSSPTPLNYKNMTANSSVSRTRRHSSFHPFPPDSHSLIDPLNVLVDESSHLSAEGIEFFSNETSSADDDELTMIDTLNASESFNLMQSADLGTEIFGSILSKVDNNLEMEGRVEAEDLRQSETTPIRGQDVLLSDNP